MSLSSGQRLDGGEWMETNERSDGNRPQIKSGMKEMCSTCSESLTVNEFLFSKFQIYERRIESLAKSNAECGSFLQESQHKIAKLNQVVALLTQQIAEKIRENNMLRVEIDASKGGKVKENNCQLSGNNLPDIDKFLEIKVNTTNEENLREMETNKEQDIESSSQIENSENSEDVQVIEEGEDEETEASSSEKLLQTCAWTVRDDKCTSARCGRVFPSVEDLGSHFNEDHLNAGHHGNYVCSWDGCKRNGEPFKSRTAIIDHFRTHSGERPFRCPFEGCDQAFRQSAALFMHRNVHSKIKFPCLDPECPKVYSIKAQMMFHYRVRHTGERKGFACPVGGCGKVYDTRSGLSNHSMTHTGKRRERRRHVCPYKCGRTYAKACDLESHVLVHVKNDMVLEEGEDEETEASSSEKQLQTCAWTVRDDEGTSARCGRVFPSAGDLASHFKEDHRNAERHAIHICLWDGCKRNGEPFKSRTAITKHFRTHSDERPFRCPFEGCDQAFRQSTALLMHRNMHLNTKYPCLDPECPKVYSLKAQMMLHYRVRHTGERKGFVCPVEDCGKVYYTRPLLKIHSASHTGDKPHVCPYECGMSFIKTRDLKRHMICHVKNDW